MPFSTLCRQWQEENFFSQMKISSLLRRFSISKLTEFMPQHLEKLMTWLQGSRETIILLQSWFCWGVSFDATTRLHFCEKGVKSSTKVYENTVLEPVVKFFKTLCSVMNNGALSIWHLPAKQTLPRSDSGGFFGLHYSGWFWVYWPFSSSDLSPMDSKSGQCLKAWSVRRGTPISKSWNAPWWKQWRISQSRHCVIQ